MSLEDTNIQKLYDHHQRITRLEAGFETLNESVSDLSATIDHLSKVLTDIRSNFTMIKWLVVGSFITIIMQNLGLIESIKLVFGKIL